MQFRELREPPTIKLRTILSQVSDTIIEYFYRIFYDYENMYQMQPREITGGIQ
jgi:hypothetical protein